MPSQETDNETPCGDHICEECPLFESGGCDLVIGDAENHPIRRQ